MQAIKAIFPGRPRPPATTQLPCSSHRSCTFHRHWTPSSFSATDTDVRAVSNNRTVLNATNNSDINTTKAENKNEGPARKLVLAPIQRLPTELLLEVISYVSPMEQACLGLTCHSLAIVLGAERLGRMSQAKTANWYMHAEMLDVLQRDFSSDEYWRCRECLRFHARRTIAAKELLKSGLRAKARSMVDLRASMRDQPLRVGIFGDPKHAEDPIYVLHYELVKAAMDRHFLGPDHGVCLKALRCAGTRTFKLTEMSEIVLAYNFVPKIAIDRLLLRSTFTFRPRETMHVQGIDLEKPTTAFLKDMDFWICGHVSTRHVLSNPKVLKWGAKNEQCPYCLTHFDITFDAYSNVCIVVYQNLGSGRSQKDEHWAHISRTGPRSRKYGWGKCKGVYGEAFLRIMCSTKEEFLRQVARSDGRGQWYDPALRKNVYKTLPESLAREL